MNIEKKQFLIACIIGDGYIRKDYKSKSCSLEISHCEKQKELVEYKADRLNKMLGKQIKIKIKNRGKFNAQDSYFFVCTHKYFRVLRKWFYKDREKQYIRKLFDYLNEEGLAIWYMDDGSLYKRIINDKFAAQYISIHTHTTEEDTDMLIKYFKERWNINFYKKRVKDKFLLKCGTKEARKFIDIVSPYILPTLKYKIDIPLIDPRVQDTN